MRTRIYIYSSSLASESGPLYIHAIDHSRLPSVRCSFLVFYVLYAGPKDWVSCHKWVSNNNCGLELC